MANIKYWLWLSRLPSLSGPMRTALLEHFQNDPEAIYFADREERALLEAVQALLAQQGVETALPEQPWTEPCAVVLLPAEELPSSPEEPAN